MNTREELYRSGAALIVGHVYPRRGRRRIPVLDPHIRARAPIIEALVGGMSPREAARHLDLPLRLVIAVGIRHFRPLAKSAEIRP